MQLKRVGRIRGTTDTIQSLPLTPFSDTILLSALELLETAMFCFGILKLGLCRQPKLTLLLCSACDSRPCLNYRCIHPNCCQIMSWGKRGSFQHHDKRQKTALAPRKWTHIEWVFQWTSQLFFPVVWFLNLVSCSRKRWIYLSLRNVSFNFLLHN